MIWTSTPLIRLRYVTTTLILLTISTANAQPAALNLGRLDQVALTISDISQAKQFYEQKLGLRKTFSQDNLLIFDLGGTRLLLGSGEDQSDSTRTSSTTLYLRCADLKLCMTELRKNGVEFDPDPEFVARQAASDLWIVFFKDPDGNSLALMSEAPRGYNPVTGTMSE